MQTWYNHLIANIKAGDTTTFNGRLWEPSSWPKQAQGVGFMEAPRGALAHWVVIEDGRSSRTTRPSFPVPGMPARATAMASPAPTRRRLPGNHTLYDPKQPIEILRTIHSFDPCIACAVHVTDPNGEELIQVKLR